jgi:membrane-associated phospholipid phosphatase
MIKKYVHTFLSNFPAMILFVLVILKETTMIVGLCTTILIVVLLKRLSNNLPKESTLYNLTRRPQSGLCCGVTCMEKKTKVTDAGFPSGHVAFISFFVSCLPQTFVLTCFKITLLFLMCYNRIKTGCHTYVQVICGMLLGWSVQKFMISYN